MLCDGARSNLTELKTFGQSGDLRGGLEATVGVPRISRLAMPTSVPAGGSSTIRLTCASRR